MALSISNGEFSSSKPGLRLRFDKADQKTSAGGSGRGSLLGIFGVFQGNGGRARPRFVPERRASDRVQPVECLAWVGWKKFRGFTMNDALLVDISRGGARIFLDQVPPADRPVWIYLETPGTQAVVRAKATGTEITSQGQCVLRVEFQEPCPYQFFEAAVCGLAASNPKTRIAGGRLRIHHPSEGLAG